MQAPDIVVGRLPIYLRVLTTLSQKGNTIISSHEIADLLGTTAAQVRKDLSYFGGFGKQGTGYHVNHLIKQLKAILGADRAWDMILVGAGLMGQALVSHKSMEIQGYRIVAVFDQDPELVNSHIDDIIVQDMSFLKQEVEQRGIKIGILAVPPTFAQHAADALVDAGIVAILCLSPMAVTVPDNVQVRSVDPVGMLQWMTYYLA